MFVYTHYLFRFKKLMLFTRLTKTGSLIIKYNIKYDRMTTCQMGNSSGTDMVFADTIQHLGFSIWNIIFILLFLMVIGVSMMPKLQ